MTKRKTPSSLSGHANLYEKEAARAMYDDLATICSWIEWVEQDVENYTTLDDDEKEVLKKLHRIDAGKSATLLDDAVANEFAPDARMPRAGKSDEKEKAFFREVALSLEKPLESMWLLAKSIDEEATCVASLPVQHSMERCNAHFTDGEDMLIVWSSKRRDVDGVRPFSYEMQDFRGEAMRPCDGRWYERRMCNHFRPDADQRLECAHYDPHRVSCER